jgi:diguanylate cyclase (GGDEF)-like protein/PAS domain S-box-containing protein
MVPFKVPKLRSAATAGDLAEPLRVSALGRDAADEPAAGDAQRPGTTDMLTQSVFETAPNGEATEISPSWTAYTGQTPEQARGYGWIDAIHPGDRAQISVVFDAAMGSGRDLSGEFRLRRADGRWCWNNIRAVRVLDAQGNLAKWVGMNIDISAQRDAEAKLAESLEDHRHAVELDPQMPWTAAPDGTILSVNDRWCRFTGQSRATAMAADFTASVHADDRDTAGAEFRRCLAAGEPYDMRFRVMTPDRGDRWVRSRAWPRRDDAGTIVRWYGFTEDIHDSVLAEEEVRAAEERYRIAAGATQDVIWDFDVSGRTVTWSDSLERLFGHRLEANRSDTKWWIAHIHPADRERVVKQVNDFLAGDDVSRWTNEYRFARADGSYAYVFDRGQVIRGADGTSLRAIGAMADLSEKRRAERAQQVGEERFRLAVGASGLGISDHDCRTDVLHWSTELRAILGVGADEPADQAMAHALIHADDRPEAADHERRARAGDFSHRYRGVRRIFRKNDGAMRWVSTEGHPIRDDRNRIVRVILTVKDVTEEKDAQDRLQWTATHDAVTGLPNRAAFQTVLDAALAAARAPGDCVALLLVDLDNFKQINDSFGHHAGDEVLRAFGARVSVALPAGGVLARFGGDEFAIVLPHAAAGQAAAIAGDLLALRSPFAVDGGSVDLRASVGVALFPLHGESAEDLVKSADIALYEAKGAGRGIVRMFEPAMRSTLQNHATMLHHARDIVDNAWAQPFYQPKIAFSSGRVTGAEALFRWHHPNSGLQSPATIANAFDDIELAAMLGETMVEAVLTDIRRWLDQGLDIGRVAINASAAEFRNPLYAERLLDRLKAHGVPASALELEITETAFLGDSDGQVLHALETVRAAGMTVALDDFGTGFSSLAHLRRFPVDTLKIDQSFVDGIDDRPGDRAIIEAVLRLGDALGLTTVAEGVETESQAAFLQGRGCKLAQGYLFAHPMPAGEVASFVARRGAERRR